MLNKIVIKMEDMVDRAVTRLRREVPDAVAVFLCGSRLRGDSGPYSDLDFDALVPDGPRDESVGWFEGPLRVSVWVRDVETWRAEPDQAQDWAFGLPAIQRLRLCWAADGRWRAALDRTEVAYPAGVPELDHLLGDLAKVANARNAGDPLGLRLAAQDLARGCPALLAPLNPTPAVATRRAALRAALSVQVAPPEYARDLTACLGLAAVSSTEDEVYAAAARLAGGVLAVLESHVDVYATLLPADLAAHLADGTLRRHVDHVLDAGP